MNLFLEFNYILYLNYIVIKVHGSLFLIICSFSSFRNVVTLTIHTTLIKTSFESCYSDSL